MSNLQQAFESLFNENMGYRSSERIVVFSDLIRADETVSGADFDRRNRLHSTARELADFASKSYGKTLFTDFPATSASGAEPPLVLWQTAFGNKIIGSFKSAGLLQTLLDKTITGNNLDLTKAIVAEQKSDVADIIIALSNNSTSHTNFRKLACLAGCRYASLPHFDPDMFYSSMTVDWQALSKRTENLVKAVNRAEWVHVTTPNGTDMMICKQGRQAEGDDGLLTFDGAFGNLPAGEAYLAPLEGKSHGKMVIEWGPTARLMQPLTLTIADGVVTEIKGDDPLRQRLEAKFTENPNCRNLAELGIGTNDKASRPDNVLEAEKILGTIHLALGDNMGFGGNTSAPFHEDYVFYQPTVTLLLADGGKEVIIDNGRLLV